MVTDGEFNSLRTQGETGPLHIWQLVHDSKEAVRKMSGPYYCFIILFNIYMCIIIYLFKRQLLSFSENELFIK